MTVELTITLVFVRPQLSPVDGETPILRLTVPVNPLAPVVVTVEVPAVPARTVTLVGAVPME